MVKMAWDRLLALFMRVEAVTLRDQTMGNDKRLEEIGRRQERGRTGGVSGRVKVSHLLGLPK